MPKAKILPLAEGVNKIEMLFYKTAPSPENTGMKFVLWEITTTEADEVVRKYDWGFGYWNGLEFEAIEVPEGYSARVMRWANTVDPSIILNESKIITSH